MTAVRTAGVGALVERLAVGTMGLFVVGFVVMHGLLIDTPVGVEEIVLFNPSYMFAQTGEVTFPVYAFFYGRRLFETFAVHPHTNYLEIGIFLRTGLPTRVAEAMPVISMSVLSVLLVLSGRFPRPAALGILFGLAAALAVSAETSHDHVFMSRPEFHVVAAWLAGLLALETGRRAGWDLRRLFLGAFLLTFASGLQWFSTGAFLGVSVYMVGAIVQLGIRRAAPIVAALIGGGMLFGIPYVLLFVLPNWDLISIVMNIGWNCTNCTPAGTTLWQLNSVPYQYFHQTLSGLSGMRFTANLLGTILGFGLPPFVLGAVLLFVVPGMRALALAAVPLPLWSYVAANHKAYYYYPEFLLLFVGLTVAVGSVIWLAARRLAGPDYQWLVTVIATAALGLAIVSSSPALATAQREIPPHRMDVARAVGRTIVGPNALVSSQHQLWYVTGAAYWHDFTNNVVRDTTAADPLAYFATFDAVADTPTWSFSEAALLEAPRSTLVQALYASGQLHLRGFLSDSYPYVAFDASGTAPVRGYARRGRSLYEFDASVPGEHVVATFVCSTGAARAVPEQLAPTEDVAFSFPISTAFAQLPFVQTAQGSTVATSVASIRGLVMPKARFDAEKAALAAGCTTRDEIAGTVSVLDAYEFTRRVNPTATPVQLFFDVGDAVIARHVSR